MQPNCKGTTLAHLMHDNEKVLVMGCSYRALRVQKLTNLHCKSGHSGIVNYESRTWPYLEHIVLRLTVCKCKM